MSIREKLFLFVLFGSILPLLLVFLVSYSQESADVRDSVESALTSEIKQSVNVVQARKSLARQKLEYFSRLSVMSRVATGDLGQILQKDIQNFADADPIFTDIIALNKHGMAVATTNDTLIATSYTDTKAFRLAMEGKPFLSAPEFDRETMQYISTQTYPIYSIGNQIIGAIIGTLDWGSLTSDLQATDVLSDGQSGDRIITLRSTDNNALLYQTKSSVVSKSAVVNRSHSKPIEVMNAGRKFVSITNTAEPDEKGRSSLLVMQMLVDEKTAYAQVHRLTGIYIWIGLVVFALVGSMWWLISQSLGQRLYRLAEGARELARGNFYYQLDEQDRVDEIGELAQSFEFMRRIIQQNETAFREKSEAAEQAARLKGEFLANMSHEVRTPINGVLGMTELMLQSDLDINQKRYASTILRSGQSLLSVVNDILDFSKIEAGKLDITEAPFDLRETVEDVVEMLAEAAHRKGLELNVEMSPETHSAFNGDAGRIRQILVNLVNNAIKFTSEGEVKVRVSNYKAKDHDLTSIKFEVQDTGIGITQEQQGRVFEEFEQADGTTTREYGGTGLGLAISSKLAELMKGSIGVTSKLGEGSTFWFTAQVTSLPESMQQRWASTDSLKDRRFIVIDDNETNREILSEQLTHWGADTLLAKGPLHALSLIDQIIEKGEHIDVAIVDFQMPDMSGTDLIKRLREKWGNRSPAFVLLSSVNEKRDADATKQLATYSHITKPVRQKDLYNCLAAALGDDSAIDATIKTETEETVEFVGNLLLVEDNPVNQEMMLEMLKILGFKVDLAKNGQEAVDALAMQDYDAVFMDCQMPVMDGFAATEIIREREAQRNDGYEHKIIALTANALQGDRERCLDAGMSDYLSKPVSMAQLRTSLRSHLGEHTRPVTKQEHEAMAKNQDSPTESMDQQDSGLPIIDNDVYQDVVAMCAQANAGFYDKLVDKYTSSSAEDLAAIEQAIADGNAETVRTSAHRLKSSSGNWGGVRVADLCQQLESAGQKGDLTHAAEMFSSLHKETAVLLDALTTEQKAA